MLIADLATSLGEASLDLANTLEMPTDVGEAQSRHHQSAQASSISGEPDYVPGIDAPDVVTVPLTPTDGDQPQIEPPPYQWTFDQSTATPIPLVYPGFADEASDRVAVESQFFEHAPVQVDLSRYASSKSPGKLHLLTEPDLTNAELFRIVPGISPDGQLLFQVTGKPGVTGSSTITVKELKNGEVDDFVRLQVSVENGPTEEDDPLSDRIALYRVFPQDAEGEGDNGFPEDEGPGDDYNPEEEEEEEEDPVSDSGSNDEGSGEFVLSNDDTTAEEPHIIYCGGVDQTGSVTLTPPDDWSGDEVKIVVGGTATWGNDYTVSATESMTHTSLPSGGHLLTISIPDTDPVTITVTALSDDDETDSDETVTFSWDSSQPASSHTYSGSGTVTIEDDSEGLDLSADPSTTLEYGDTPGTYHIKPQDSGHTLCTTVYLRINASGDNAAKPFADEIWPDTDSPDYDLRDEEGNILDVTHQGNGIYHTEPFPIQGDSDFLVHVEPVDDGKFEGDELVIAKVIDATVNDIESSSSTITIEEDYLDERVIKEEDTDPDSQCNRACPTCACGVMIDVANGYVRTPLDASAPITVVDDAMRSTTPSVTVLLPIPSGKAVPEKVEIQARAVEQDSANPTGTSSLGSVTSEITYNVSQSGSGDHISVKFQLDLSSVLDEDGLLGAQTINIEIWAHPVFAYGTDDEDMFSGWIGRATHVVSDVSQSGLSEAFAPGVNWTFNKYLTTDPWLVASTAANSVGIAAVENGATIVRADGSYSWYPSTGTLPPESTSVLVGNKLTHKDGSYDLFNLTTGRLSKMVDPAGNETSFSYDTQGRLGSIVDPLGRTTTVDYDGWVPASGGGYVVQDRTVTITDPYGAETELVWSPATDKLTVKYPDPDGTGPRNRCKKSISTTAMAFCKVSRKGKLAQTGTQTTTLSHDFNASTQTGSRGLLSLSRSGAGTTTIDMTRRREALVPAGTSGTIYTYELHGARRVSGTTLPYQNLTSITDGEGNRVIYRLDHRGRVTQMFDPQQVARTWDWMTLISVRPPIGRRPWDSSTRMPA